MFQRRPLPSVEGIDVSLYQCLPEFGAVAADGIKFVYLKATEGAKRKDAHFDPVSACYTAPMNDLAEWEVQRAIDAIKTLQICVKNPGVKPDALGRVARKTQEHRFGSGLQPCGWI